MWVICFEKSREIWNEKKSNGSQRDIGFVQIHWDKTAGTMWHETFMMYYGNAVLHYLSLKLQYKAICNHSFPVEYLTC